MSNAYQIGQLVEKMSNQDKDYRFMAANDLLKDLKAGQLGLEEDSTAKVVRALIRLLNDNNGEVQSLAIQCIGTLVQPTRISLHHLEFLIDDVTPKIWKSTESARDVHALTIKAILENLGPVDSVATIPIVRRLVPKIVTALGQNYDDAVKIELIDILADVLLRFGDAFADSHESVHQVLLEQLNSSRQSIRKKATTAIGNLAVFASPALYDTMVSGLLFKLGNAKAALVCRTYIVALTFIAKSSGAKFSDHLSKVVPYLIQFLRSSDDDDLREASLQGLEMFLYRCPAEVASFQTDVQQVLSTSLCYDPNYEYGDDDEDEDMEMDEDEDDYSDDEDMTWKVRRSAAKAIEAMVNSRKEALLSYVINLGPLLVSRFKEREETVRVEILSAYIGILKQILIVIPHLQSAIVRNDSDSMQTDDISTIANVQFSTNYLSSEQISIIKALSEQMEKLLRTLTKLLKRQTKSGTKILELLTILVKLYPNALDAYLADFIPGILKIFTEKSATAQGKMIVISFISAVLDTHDASVFQPLLEPVTSIVASAINDPFYKVSAEGLILATKYIDTLRKVDNSLVYSTKLFDVINSKFSSNDTDQDVRERSIIAISRLVSVFRTEFEPKLPHVLDKLVERAGKEMTCLVAIRSISGVIESGIVFETELLKVLLVQITEYLKKNSRALRVGCLGLINNLMSFKSNVPQAELTDVLGQLPFLNDNDLQMTNQILTCLLYGFNDYPQCVEPHFPKILKSLVKLLQSSLLQGAALQTLLKLCSAIVTSNISSKPSFVQLLDTLTSPVYDVPTLSRQAHSSISACVSVIAVTTNDLAKSRSLTSKLREQLIDNRSSVSIKVFSMCTLGELGRRCPEIFAESDPSAIRPETLAVEAFNSNLEELRAAAAQALGALAVGNLQYYLPFILKQINQFPKRQYLLLHALKEVIVWESSEDANSTELFKSAIGDIWNMLINNIGGQEDGTRTVVSECLGRLCSFDPENLLPKLREHVSSNDPIVRATVVSAVKYMINDRKNADAVLQKTINDFLIAVNDPDIQVRRVALVVLNSAAHNKPVLIRDLLPHLLPAVYKETVMRKELIREVEMGPFKHQVDDGLDLRKCAFECMYTLLENCIDKIDVTEFLAVLEVGLRDANHDIKLLNFLTIQKMIPVAPGQILQRVDKICDPLKHQLNVKVRSNAVKQEVEKLEELKKAVIRLIFMIRTKLPEVDRQQQFFELYSFIRQKQDLEVLAEAVVRESQRSVVYDVPMES